MLRFARFFTAAATAASILAATVTTAPAAQLAATAPDTGVEQQLVDAVNTDRAQLGLARLIVDPRLTEIARNRGQYIIDQGVSTDLSKFSHCVNGGESCSSDQLHFGILLAQAGFRQLNAGENLAINNKSADAAASSTNDQWMASPHHRPQIVNATYNVTGLGVICCTSVKNSNGQTVNNVRLYTQIFAQYSSEMLASLTGTADPASTISVTVAPASVASSSGISLTAAPASAIPAPVAPAPAAVGACQYILGFKSLHDLDVSDTGDCTENQAFAANGDAQQHTTAGLMAWRKADNWTAFTNGYWTWINGPNGLAKRLNTERFTWEANPDGLPIAS